MNRPVDLVLIKRLSGSFAAPLESELDPDLVSAAPALFTPFEAVATFGVLFVLAGAPDEIADDALAG